MNKLFEIISTHIKAIFNLLFLSLVALGLFWVYQTFFGYYVLIRFKELGPLTKNMTAYYKGFVIGKSTSVGPDEDYKASIVKVVLKHENTMLPSNTFVIVGQFPNGQNYLEFIYPDKPTLRLMGKGDVLEGITSYSLEQFMHGQTRSGTTDLVSENVIKTLNTTDETNREIQNFFATASEVLQENRQNIKQTTQNTAKMTASLAQSAKNTVSMTASLAQSAKTLNEATENIKTTTADINKATKDTDKTTNKIHSTMSEFHAAAANINKITAGMLRVLNKKFAGMRILFGRPIQADETQNNCD